MKPDLSLRYSWDDYFGWEGEERWELVDGRPYLMGSPTVLHQAICGELYAQLHPHFRGGPCRVLFSPLAVKLSEQDAVQPDLLVVCDPEKLRKGYVDGPPDLVIEVGSPSTVRHDRLRKLNLYAAAGIAEYWLVTPQPFLLEVLSNRNGQFTIVGSYSETDHFRSQRFRELELDLTRMDLPDPDQIREVSPEYATL